MANEIQHTNVGADLTETEYHATGAHSITAQSIATTHLADAAVTQAQVKTKAVVALADAAATLTAAQMVDSSIFTITPTVARILTTDTAANIVAALPRYQAGTWFDITIINLAGFDVTLAAGTGVTLTGRVIVNNESSTWRVRIDSAVAVTIYSMALAAAGALDIRVRVYNDANISLTNATLTALTFNTEQWDTDTMHSTVSNTGRLTATTAGYYVITGAVLFAANATGKRLLRIRLNGTTTIAEVQDTNAGGVETLSLIIGTQYNLAATEYVEFLAYQDSGGALNVLDGSLNSPEFAMVKVLG